MAIQGATRPEKQPIKMKTYILVVVPDGQGQSSELCTKARSVDQAALNLANWWANMHGKNAGYSLKEIRSVPSID